MAKPSNRFTLPCKTVLLGLDGEPLTEPTPDKTGVQEITLGLVLSAAINVDKMPEGVTLTILDRLDLLRRFKDAKKDPELKIETVLQLKKLVAERFANSPLLGGQALELLGDKPADL